MIINKNNQKENAKCIPYTYKKGDLVLLERDTENKCESPFSRLHKIIKVSNNGTERLTVNKVTDTYNIQ